MTSNRILQLNASATAASALGMLATRGFLYQFFGAGSPALFDAIAIGLLLYAAALAYSAWQPSVERRTLIAYTVADGLWVAGSVVALMLFWDQLAPIARALVIGCAVVVDVFAMLQYRAATRTAVAA